MEYYPYKDKWYLFYHDSSLSGGADNKRCVKYTELKYNADGTIQKVDIFKKSAKQKKYWFINKGI